MKIANGDYEYRLNYRFPWEFIFCAWKFRRAVSLWIFYCWTDTMKNLWFDKGYRLLGIEFMERKYGRTENAIQNIADDLIDHLPQEKEPLYPCKDCGKLRTKAEGGTTFTVCDECWDKHYKKEPTKESQEKEDCVCAKIHVL